MSSLLIRRLYDGVSESRDGGGIDKHDKDYDSEVAKQRTYIRGAAKQFKSALADYVASLSPDFETIRDEHNTLKYNSDKPPFCIFADSDDVFGQDLTVSRDQLAESNALGYLAMLAALSEFADGNRESAIHLMHDRIEREKENLDYITQYIRSGNVLYLTERKRAMLTRLIRVEVDLIELVQNPVRSPVLDQIAFDLMIKGMKLDPLLLMANKANFDNNKDKTTRNSEDVSKDRSSKVKDADSLVMAALKPASDGHCSDRFLPVVPKPKEGESDLDYSNRTAFYNAVVNHLISLMTRSITLERTARSCCLLHGVATRNLSLASDPPLPRPA